MGDVWYGIFHQPSYESISWATGLQGATPHKVDARGAKRKFGGCAPCHRDEGRALAE